MLYGKDIREFIPKPTAQELIVMGARFALDYLATSEKIEEINSPKLIYNKGVRYLTKAILFPVRLLYTALTGKIGHNEDAVNYYLDQIRQSVLVKSAFQWRSQTPLDKHNAMLLMKNELLPVYIEFIDIYHQKMIVYGENEIADKLLHWKSTFF